MKHRRSEIEQKQAESPPGGGERCKKNENADRDRAQHPEKPREDVSLIDVSQTGNDTEHHCDHVACFAFRGLCRAAHPIAAVAAFGVFRQKMPAVRARHLIASGRLRPDSRRIRVFHVHTYRKSQAAPNSSSTENQAEAARLHQHESSINCWRRPALRPFSGYARFVTDSSPPEEPVCSSQP